MSRGAVRPVKALLALALVAAAGPAPVWAHGDLPASGAAGALAWPFDPLVLACLLLSLAAYALGLRRLWRHAGRGRGIRPRQAAAFAAGWGALALALASPLDPWGLRLFSAHMLQHELMMVVAAPLLCLAQPLVAWTWALPPAARRAAGRFTRHAAWSGLWRWLDRVFVAWSLHAVLLWGWHLPALFERALHDERLHAVQHLAFLFSALLFWWSVLRPGRPARQCAALVSVFTTMLHTAALGALLALSPLPVYPSYVAGAAALGIGALEDQQLGGLVMWVPTGLAYLAAGLALVMRWLAPAPHATHGDSSQGGIHMASTTAAHSAPIAAASPAMK